MKTKNLENNFNISQTEIIDNIQLIRCENIGPITYYKIIEKFGSAKNALENFSEVSKISNRN
ncbi:MAG: hypothetical protein ACKO46_00730, partial [Alphaproteobacteria bacterium]